MLDCCGIAAWNVPSRSGTTAAGSVWICPAGHCPWPRRGLRRPQPRSHAGPWIQFFDYFSVNPFRATRDRTKTDRIRHLGISDISFRLRADHAAIAPPFFQVNRAFSPRVRPRGFLSNRDPNHADIVNWNTFGWRAGAATGTKQRAAGRARVRACYSKCRRSDVRHAVTVLGAPRR